MYVNILSDAIVDVTDVYMLIKFGCNLLNKIRILLIGHFMK